jgi:hypothetical protein
MATIPTSLGPIGTRQINRNFYVGQGDLTTIQKAVDAAIVIGSGSVIIPAGYTGADTIAAVTGGSTGVSISDQRTTSPQNYAWSGTNYMPADFNQLANIRGVNGIFSDSVSAQQDLACGQDLIVEGNGSFGETVSIVGDVSAANADFVTCEVGSSPVRTFANTPDGPGEDMVWPPIGIPLSLGDHWQNPSIDPDSLVTWPAAGVPVSTGSAWATPIDPASLATWPAAGVPVSTGTTWSTPIVASTIARLNAAQTWTAPQQLADATVEGQFQAVKGVWAGPEIFSYEATQGGVHIGTGTDGASPAVVHIFGEIGGDSAIWENVAWATSMQWNCVAANNTDRTTYMQVLRDGWNVSQVNFNAPSINMVASSTYSFTGAAVFNVGSAGLHTTGGCAADGGFFTSGPKAFRIGHPTDDSKILTHASLEGPELGVYYRGEGITEGGWAEIVLPDYFEALVREENRTVLLTPLFEDDADQIGMLAASRVKEGKFKVWSALGTQKFYWEVKAVRDDIEPLVVEEPDTEPSKITSRRRPEATPR